MPPALIRCLNALGAAVFVAFAWLQREDDDPQIYDQPSMWDVAAWVGFYALVAVAFGLAIARRFPRWLFLAILGLGIFHMVTTLPGIWDNLRSGTLEMAKESMSPERAEVELSREFFGVLIAFLGTWMVWIQRGRAR